MARTLGTLGVVRPTSPSSEDLVRPWRTLGHVAGAGIRWMRRHPRTAWHLGDYATGCVLFFVAPIVVPFLLMVRPLLWVGTYILWPLVVVFGGGALVVLFTAWLIGVAAVCRYRGAR